MNVVFATSECTPFASTGGLADVSGALPRALAADGCQVVRFLPFYRQIIERGHAVVPTGIKLAIPVGYATRHGELWRIKDDGGVPTYLVAREEYFDRSELYGLPSRDYEDNCERFSFFQKAVVDCIDIMDLKPDVVHSNDWQTGLMPLYLKHGIRGRGRHGGEKTVFTIHNLAYQGIFPGAEMATTGLPFSTYQIDVMEFYGNISFMKAGITGAHQLTTVSPTYAREIQGAEQGCGLEGVIAQNSHRLAGILNGVDCDEWNPATDPLLPARFETGSMAGKKKCKQALIKRVGLNIDVDTPLIGMVTRLVDQKGLDLLAKTMDLLMTRKVGFVLLGTGQQEYHALATEWAKAWPGRFSLHLRYDTEMAHLIEGGSDFYMMPSRYEPCGLNQLYSLRYGTIPIVHATGGLADTVQEASADGESGTGFAFTPYDADQLIAAVDRAIALYADKPAWRKVQKRAMEQDFSWRHASREYAEIYQRLVAGPAA